MNLKFDLKIPNKFKSESRVSSESWKQFQLFLNQQESAFAALPTDDEIETIKSTRKHFSNQKQIVHIGINSYDQPAVELAKSHTKKIFKYDTSL